MPFVIPSFRFPGRHDPVAHGTSNGQGILAELFSAVVDASQVVDDGDRCTSSLFLGWRAARTVEGRAEHAAGGSDFIENSSQLYHNQNCRSIRATSLDSFAPPLACTQAGVLSAYVPAHPPGWLQRGFLEGLLTLVTLERRC